MFQAQGQKNAARFSRLKRNVDGFRKNVKEIISDQQVAVGRKIKTLEKNIAELQADLERSVFNVINNPFVPLEIISL
jgi:hypothetical protein